LIFVDKIFRFCSLALKVLRRNAAGSNFPPKKLPCSGSFVAVPAKDGLWCYPIIEIINWTTVIRFAAFSHARRTETISYISAVPDMVKERLRYIAIFVFRF